jgi:hypothetical protein
VGDSKIPKTATGIIGLASMHQRNQNRARTLAGLSEKRRARAASRRSSTGMKKREIQITNWHTGRGYMREIADNAIDDYDSFEESMEGMNR